MKYLLKMQKRKNATLTKGKIKGDIILRCLCKVEKNNTSVKITNEALEKMNIGEQLYPDIPTGFDSYCSELIKLESNRFLLTKFHHLENGKNIAYEKMILEME